MVADLDGNASPGPIADAPASERPKQWSIAQSEYGFRLGLFDICNDAGPTAFDLDIGGFAIIRGPCPHDIVPADMLLPGIGDPEMQHSTSLANEWDALLVLLFTRTLADDIDEGFGRAMWRHVRVMQSLLQIQGAGFTLLFVQRLDGESVADLGLFALFVFLFKVKK
jgi:hypothetical protein